MRITNNSLTQGFERAWSMSVRSTLEDASIGELQVHFVEFSRGTLLNADEVLEARLPWPEAIERSAPLRQTEFVFGRLAVRHALASVSPSLINTEVRIGTNREPLWPEGVIGSLTHVAGLAGAAVVASRFWRFLGIDLERPARGESQHALRALVLDEAELSLLLAASPLPDEADLDARVTQVFSAKESLFKAAFPEGRRYFGFSAARLCDYEVAACEPGPKALLVLEVRKDVGGAFVVGSRWRVELWSVPGTDACLSVLAG